MDELGTSTENPSTSWSPAPPGTVPSSPDAVPAPPTSLPNGFPVAEPIAPPPVHVAQEALPPLEFQGDESHIDDFLRYTVAAKASDLHAKVGSIPMIRVSGNLEVLDYHMLQSDEAIRFAEAMMSEKERSVLESDGEVDFAYSVAGLGRFRVNIHRQRGSIGIAARRILPGAPDFKDLGLPPAVEQLANAHRGLFLVTGPTSSGKTTTCGAIIKHINQTRRCHILTIEYPIEILHRDEKSVVTQREVGADTNGFLPALRAAMRQDPDVIFVGEIRDTETVGAALQAAETGHFVLATLHTTNVAETITRIIDFFPSHQQKQIRVALAGSLVGVVTQRLLPKVGGGRAPALEVMVMNGRIRDTILDGDRTHEMLDIVAESGFYGMQTFDQALVQLYRAGLVTLEDAKSAATVPQDLELQLKREGLLKV
ncbi:MAG: twitching motility protein PilT [Actinomycetota bacterium]|nr:twitching motility protein PilT [Actinomycetota bacterium]